MRRALLLAVIAALLVPAVAGAHPLGNFSVNHLDRVSITQDAVEVQYLLDQAEIPTFQQRDLAPDEVLARVRAEVQRGLTVRVDGRSVPLRVIGAGTIAFPAGEGGLPTTRVELSFSAPAPEAREVVVTDDTYPGRVGWKALQVVPGEGTAVRTSVPRDDPTDGLRTYPPGVADSPSDVRRGTFMVRAGAGTVAAPGSAPIDGGGGEEDGLAGLFEDAAAGEGVLLLLLLAACGWGAVHALSPGHGKTMVAAYLVGSRGTLRDAGLLGLTVTVTHTAGVFALGFVTLGLSAYVLPEQLYPWLELASALLILGVGAAVLRKRARAAARAHHHDHDHDHHHHHGPPEDRSLRSILGMGAAAGLLPCPSALVVLLSAVSQHQVGLGLVLILAFSLGLAGTLVAVGGAVVWARRFGPRLPRRSRLARVASALPAASAALILVVGCVLTVQSVGAVAGA